MKVLVEFDLSCPNQELIFQSVKAKMHAQDLPEVTRQAVEETKQPVEVSNGQVTLSSVRQEIKDLQEIDQGRALQLIMQLQTDFGGHPLSEMSQDQLTVIHDKVSRELDSYKGLPNAQ